MGNDVIYNKIEIIERCIDRVNEVYEGDHKNLEDYTKQDSIILNIQRACEAAIDIAMHIVSEKRLGIPQNSRDAFDVLCSNKMVSADLNKKLKSMIGFRNIAVHNYKALNLEIVREVIEKHMEDFREFIYEINQIK
jgi:uncharacterized protein YutE (UPF0331/DUF86 family)